MLITHIVQHRVTNVNSIKSYHSHKAYRMVLINLSCFSPQPDSSRHQSFGSTL